MTIPVHVALVDDTHSLKASELQLAAGALSQQVAMDFAPVWHVAATVGAYEEAPANTWAIRIQAQLDEPGALGYHTDLHNQPVSYVMLTDDWTTTVSHELLEMLADPFGNRMHGARLPIVGGSKLTRLEDHYKDFGLHHASSHVQYLLEVCDPCEATSYEVGGVAVSDFLYPDWYRTNPPVHPHYSLRGLPAPRAVAPGGYVSFCNPLTGEWYQVFAGSGGAYQVSDLGKFDRAKHGSLREFTDEASRAYRAA
jgi:hypothetical protein